MLPAALEIDSFIRVPPISFTPALRQRCLNAGVNDMGGTLMNESISRAAGSIHGQEFEAKRMEKFIKDCRRLPQQRNTLYESIHSDELSEIPFDVSVAHMQSFLNSAHPVV